MAAKKKEKTTTVKGKKLRDGLVIDQITDVAGAIHGVIGKRGSPRLDFPARSLSNVVYDEILKEIKLALQECGRRVGIHVNKSRRAEDEARKRGYIDMYLPHIGIALQQILKLSDPERNKTCTDLKAILEKTRKVN